MPEAIYSVWAPESFIIFYSKSTVQMSLTNAVQSRFHLTFMVSPPFWVTWLKILANGNPIYDGVAWYSKDETYEIPLSYLRDGENIFEAQVTGLSISLGADVIIEYTTPGCHSDADCPSGYRCLNGTCVPIGCSSDADCPPGYRCINGECMWIPPTNGGLALLAVGVAAFAALGIAYAVRRRGAKR